MKRTAMILGLVLAVCGSIASAETHKNLQAVDSTGDGTHPDIKTDNKVTVEGIILNRSEYMVNGAPNYNEIAGNIGGEWQIYIQGDASKDPNDHAGTAVWMGQNYKNRNGTGRYTNEEWVAEIDRLNYDPAAGHRFMPGDKVKVTGLLKFYGGKTNINERHNTAPANDLTIELVAPGAGLPEPEVITLDQVKDSGDVFIFDPNRVTGCEKYQARLVCINDVSFVDESGWAPNAALTITDGTRTFPVKLGIGPGITLGSNNLSSPFDIIAIFDQEDTVSTDGFKAGYRLWVTNYDGNDDVLADGCDLHGIFSPADFNRDCRVNLCDFAIFAQDWMVCTNLLICP